MSSRKSALVPTGRFSPLRYPGGKGKLARFVEELIVENGLTDGTYIEPYAGGAAVAWELLLTGVVRRVEINDLNLPLYCFWQSVLEETEQLARLIHDTDITVETWDAQKSAYRNAEREEALKVGFAFFYLNRTNRSGILNGGIIGGREQEGNWKIDARFNKSHLISRIEHIARYKNRIKLTNLDAYDFVRAGIEGAQWDSSTLIYFDPPYFEKGRDLYPDYYKPDDHSELAAMVRDLECVHWVVSYDDVLPIHELYPAAQWLQYSIGYSARNRLQGREAMFFSDGLKVPEVTGSMCEIDRDVGGALRRAPVRRVSEMNKLTAA